MVTVPTNDGRVLDAYHCRPFSDGPRERGILHIHGKGGNFYSGPGRFLPALIREEGIGHLSLNMRFHDLAYTRCDLPGGDTTEFPVDGGMWESIQEGWRDVAAGVRWLRDQGYAKVFITGHSAGGYYVGEYAAQDPGLSGCILLSPLHDHRFILSEWFKDKESLAQALAAAGELVAAGRGGDLIPVSGWFHAISARTLLERASQPDGLWLRALRASSVPVLFVWGAAESRSQVWNDIWEGLPTVQKTRVVIDDCEHFYVGFEGVVADAVRAFLLSAV